MLAVNLGSGGCTVVQELSKDWQPVKESKKDIYGKWDMLRILGMSRIHT